MMSKPCDAPVRSQRWRCALPEGHGGAHAKEWEIDVIRLTRDEYEALRAARERLAAAMADLAESVVEQCDGNWVVPTRQEISKRLRNLAEVARC